MTESVISTAMSDEEMRLARIHDAVNRSGLDPTTILDLVTGLVEDDFADDDISDETRERFRRLIEDEADVSLEKLVTVILDREHFPHRYEGERGEQLDRMRRRVRELAEGRLHENGEIGRGRSFDNIKPNDGGTSESYRRRRLRRDNPELLERVDSGELTVNQAAVEAGFGRRYQSVRLDDPDRAARTLRQHMDPEALGQLVALLLEQP